MFLPASDISSNSAVKGSETEENTTEISVSAFEDASETATYDCTDGDLTSTQDGATDGEKKKLDQKEKECENDMQIDTADGDISRLIKKFEKKLHWVSCVIIT